MESLSGAQAHSPSEGFAQRRDRSGLRNAVWGSHSELSGRGGGIRAAALGSRLLAGSPIERERISACPWEPSRARIDRQFCLGPGMGE